MVAFDRAFDFTAVDAEIDAASGLSFEPDDIALSLAALEIPFAFIDRGISPGVADAGVAFGVGSGVYRESGLCDGLYRCCLYGANSFNALSSVISETLALLCVMVAPVTESSSILHSPERDPSDV